MIIKVLQSICIICLNLLFWRAQNTNLQNKQLAETKEETYTLWCLNTSEKLTGKMKGKDLETCMYDIHCLTAANSAGAGWLLFRNLFVGDMLSLILKENKNKE